MGGFTNQLQHIERIYRKGGQLLKKSGETPSAKALQPCVKESVFPKSFTNIEKLVQDGDQQCEAAFYRPHFQNGGNRPITKVNS